MLQLSPTSQDFITLALELLEFKLLRLGRSRVGAAHIHGQVCQLGVQLRRIRQRVFVGADSQVHQLFANRDQFLFQVIRRSRDLRAGSLRQTPFHPRQL